MKTFPGRQEKSGPVPAHSLCYDEVTVFNEQRKPGIGWHPQRALTREADALAGVLCCLLSGEGEHPVGVDLPAVIGKVFDLSLGVNALHGVRSFLPGFCPPGQGVLALQRLLDEFHGCLDRAEGVKLSEALAFSHSHVVRAARALHARDLVSLDNLHNLVHRSFLSAGDQPPRLGVVCAYLK